MSNDETGRPAPADLARLRIRREEPRSRRWVGWTIAAILVVGAVSLYPIASPYLAARRAPDVEIARATRVVPAVGDQSTAMPVLVASGYVIARRSADVGGKVGGRISYLGVEEGSRVAAGQIIARLEHAELDAQLEAARTEVNEARALVAEAAAARAEEARNLERQRALGRDGIVTDAAVTSAEAAAEVSEARVQSAEAALASAQARVHVAEEQIENTNVRAPFNGVVIAKRAEIGETVSPFGVAGQATREGGAIATIADLSDLEVETEVSESNVARLRDRMPAAVSVQAYPDMTYQGRLRQIFPAADRAKAIVEVRVSILNPDARVKPEMTARVTFQESAPAARTSSDVPVAIILIPRRAVIERNGQPHAWVVTSGKAVSRVLVLGPERLDMVEIRSGIAPGDAVIINPPEGLSEGGVVKVKAGG